MQNLQLCIVLLGKAPWPSEELGWGPSVVGDAAKVFLQMGLEMTKNHSSVWPLQPGKMEPTCFMGDEEGAEFCLGQASTDLPVGIQCKMG